MLIGLFDSGVGGLTVLSACKKVLPDARFLYLDDTAHAPYGDKPAGRVTELADACVKTLLKAGCDAVIIACNTATAAAAAYLRAAYPGEIILGLEPAVKPALAAVGGKVLLLATPVTATLKRYSDRVIVGTERTLAADVERAYGDPAALKKLADDTLAKYADYDAVVTGCSHYAHLIPYIDKPVFDGAEGVARRAAELLKSREILNG